VVIVPIFRNEEQKAVVLEAIGSLEQQLGGIRLHVDRREGLTPGFKFNHWELRGVPLRLEVGPKEVEENSVVIARRDSPGRKGKQVVSQQGLASTLTAQLEDLHRSLYERAEAFRQANTHAPEDYDQFKEVLKDGWADVWWCGEGDCEETIKEDTKATVRCIPLDQPGGQGECIGCGHPAHERALFSRAY
jgi:prolyl-tRNA synthetase